MDRFSTFVQSQPARFFAVALVASFVTLQVHTLYTDIRSKSKKDRLNRELQELYREDNLLASRLDPEAINENGGMPSLASAIGNGAVIASTLPLSVAGFDEGLIREQLARNYAFFGEGGMTKIRASTVVIVGCGGVGSWAAMMLARTGVSKLKLIDFDYVTLSSLNRHATATRADVGTPKTHSLKHAIAAVVPWVQVEACVELWNIENEKENGWLEGADWIVDAIDNISTKVGNPTITHEFLSSGLILTNLLIHDAATQVDLLSYCHSKGFKVISSMGAGAKHDPSHIQSADISQTVADPLARSVRRRLRMHHTHPVFSGIPVVYSTEVPSSNDPNALGLLPLADEEFKKGAVHELAPFADFRVRILPVLGMIPAIFGMHVATYLVCELGGRKVEEPLPVKGRRKLWEKLAKELTARESKWGGWDTQRYTAWTRRLPLSDQEVGFVFEELHRSKSSLPPYESLSRPTLVRWNLGEPLTVANCVVMSPQDVTKHEEGFRNGQSAEELWGTEVASAVQKRRREAEEWIKAIY